MSEGLGVKDALDPGSDAESGVGPLSLEGPDALGSSFQVFSPWWLSCTPCAAAGVGSRGWGCVGGGIAGLESAGRQPRDREVCMNKSGMSQGERSHPPMPVQNCTRACKHTHGV